MATVGFVLDGLGINLRETKMAWWQGVDETRLLIAPTAPGANGNLPGSMLSLPHPKSGNTTCYLLLNGLLQELHWFKQPYSSWFMGNYIREDGGIYAATLVDPVFILLPVFEEARMKKEDDPGKFRQLEEIMFINGHPGYQSLMSIAENCMQTVCEIKEIGSSKFFRLDDSKVLAWLCYKVCQLKEALLSLDENYAAQDEKTTLAAAVTIMGEYVTDEPWLALLSNHFKLNSLEQTREDAESFHPAVKTNPGSSDISQDDGRSEKKTKRSGRPSKKARADPESQNIKEMFFRAHTRSGR